MLAKTLNDINKFQVQHQNFDFWVNSADLIIDNYVAEDRISDDHPPCYILIFFYWSNHTWYAYLTVLFVVDASSLLTIEPENNVLKALFHIIDPEFGTDIVTCGLVKGLHVNDASGEVF